MELEPVWLCPFFWIAVFLYLMGILLTRGSFEVVRLTTKQSIRRVWLSAFLWPVMVFFLLAFFLAAGKKRKPGDETYRI